MLELFASHTKRRTGNAESGYHFTKVIAHRRPYAAQPVFELFIINRVAALANYRQFGLEPRRPGDRVAGVALELNASNQLTRRLGRQMRENRFALRGAVERRPAAHG